MECHPDPLSVQTLSNASLTTSATSTLEPRAACQFPRRHIVCHLYLVIVFSSDSVWPYRRRHRVCTREDSLQVPQRPFRLIRGDLVICWTSHGGGRAGQFPTSAPSAEGAHVLSVTGQEVRVCAQEITMPLCGDVAPVLPCMFLCSIMQLYASPWIIAPLTRALRS